LPAHRPAGSRAKSAVSAAIEAAMRMAFIARHAWFCSLPPAERPLVEKVKWSGLSEKYHRWVENV